MATHTAKYLSKDESKGFLANKIFKINTQVVNQRIVVESADSTRQAKAEYNSKRDFLRDWMVIE